MTSYAAPSPPMLQARHFGGSQTPRALVIHGTVSPDTPGQARSIAAWWHGPTSPLTSAHYVVDPTTVMQCVPDHNEAFHCGYNRNSIGIELADEEVGPKTRWRDKNSTAIIERAALLAAQLCLAYDIDPVRPSVAELKAKGPHGIYGHNDSRLAFGNTTHSDPIDFPWDFFLKQVRDEIARLKGSGAAARKVTRIERVHQNYLKHASRIQVKPLEAAVKAGRKGAVRRSVKDFEAAMDRLMALPDSQVGPHGKRAKQIWKKRRVIAVNQLNLAVKTGHGGVVKKIRDDVLAAYSHLPRA